MSRGFPVASTALILQEIALIDWGTIIEPFWGNVKIPTRDQR